MENGIHEKTSTALIASGAAGMEAGHPIRVLVADDAANIRLGLTRLLQKWGYEVEAAADGDEAWALFENGDFQFVITDWMMPGCDGPELCKRIRRRGSQHYTYVILLTARDEKDALVEGMEAGADDYLVKPFNRRELEVRIKAGERILRLEQDLEQRNSELTRANTRLTDAYRIIEDDLKAAAQMQTGLLPEKSVALPGVSFDWLFIPSTFVGGDILNFWAIRDHEVLFYALDVSGHGVQAAMLSVSLNQALNRSFCDEHSGYEERGYSCPASIVSALNDQFQTAGDDSRYFTIVLGILDTRTGLVRLCQAGHPYPLLVTVSGAVSTVGDGGMPVGMLPDMRYDSVQVQMEIGDRLYLHSDGITECEDPDGEQFGTERFSSLLVDTLTNSIGAGLEHLQKTVSTWQGSSQFDDDVSVLTLERCAT